MAAAADDITGGVLPRLTDALVKLSTMLAAADPGKDTALVKAEVSNLAFQIQTVSSMTNGLSAKILAYTPAQYDTNHELLSGTRQTLLSAGPASPWPRWRFKAFWRPSNESIHATGVPAGAAGSGGPGCRLLPGVPGPGGWVRSRPRLGTRLRPRRLHRRS